MDLGLSIPANFLKVWLIVLKIIQIDNKPQSPHTLYKVYQTKWPSFITVSRLFPWSL